MKIATNDIVYVKWEDHTTDSNGWTALEDDWPVCVPQTVGIVVKNSKKYLTLTMTIDDSNATGSQFLTIIKSTIIKMKKLGKLCE